MPKRTKEEIKTLFDSKINYKTGDEISPEEYKKKQPIEAEAYMTSDLAIELFDMIYKR